MLYNLLKFILKIALRVFFKSLKINNKENAPQKGALLVVANHPNTFMDPLVIASLLKPQVFFIANASIFSNGFTKWLFKNLNMIPIQRKHDTNKEKFDNTKIFDHCYKHLGKNGTILIFPEGTSIRARRLQTLKNGTARIALGAEATHQFGLNLKILTIGLNYSKPESFRSEVFVNVDEPIVVKDFQKLYEENETEAINRLTETIKERLEKHTIVTRNDAQDHLAKQIEELYAPILEDEIQLSQDQKEQKFLIKKGIIEAIQYFEEKDPQRIADFRPKIDLYIRMLHRLHLSDQVFNTKKNTSNKNNIWLESITNIFYFIIGFPLFVYGFLNNYIPYIIPSKIAQKISDWAEMEEYTAPVMMVSGVFTFGFFYFWQIFFCQYFLQNWLITLIYALSLPISGFFALFYVYHWNSIEDKWRMLSIFSKKANMISELVALRKEIFVLLEKAKKDYFN